MLVVHFALKRCIYHYFNYVAAFIQLTRAQARRTNQIFKYLRVKDGAITQNRTAYLPITKQIHKYNICDILKRRAKKAGIDKRVHPHGLRHTHAMELIADEKIPLNALQKQLGHTTSIYVDHLGADEVIEIGKNRTDW